MFILHGTRLADLAARNRLPSMHAVGEYARLQPLRVRNLDAPELHLVHSLLDSWRAIGLVVVGMARQGSQVSLG